METLSIILILVMGASVAYPIIFNKWGTVSLIIGNTLVFSAVLGLSMLGYNGTFYRVVMDLIFFPSDLTSYRIYTTMTSSFLHVAPMHIFMNLVFLFLLGFPLEIKAGSRLVALLYLPSAIGGSILYALLAPENTPALGASGAISGLLGALVALYPRDEIPMFLGPIFLRKVPVFIVAAVFLLMEGAYSFASGSSDNVAHTAHIGGLIAGMAVGAVISKMAFRGGRPSGMSVKGLEELAVNEELREMLHKIENEKNPEIRDAWLEEFASSSNCPKCRGSLRIEGKKILCESCGWERRIE